MNDPYLDDADAPRSPGRSRTIVVAGIAVAALAGFGGLIWYAYNLGSAQPGGVPTITAQTGPVRREPTDPGGAKVEHTDKDVYGVLERTGNKPRVERMLPPPETPMARPPEPPPVAVAVAPPAPPPVAPPPPVATAPTPTGQGAAAGRPPAAPPPPATAAVPPPGRPPVPADRNVAVVPAAPVPARPPAAVPPAAVPPPADRSVAAVPVAPPAPPPAAPAAGQAAKPTPLKPEPNRQVAALPPPAEPPKPVENKPAEAKPAETKPPPAAAQPAPRPGTGPVRVQFGAYRSEEEAKQTWAKLRGQNGDLLGRLGFMTESVQRADGTVLHRVQGGTLSDAAAGQFLCDQMKARKVDCIVVKR